MGEIFHFGGSGARGGLRVRFKSIRGYSLKGDGGLARYLEHLAQAVSRTETLRFALCRGDAVSRRDMSLPQRRCLPQDAYLWSEIECQLFELPIAIVSFVLRYTAQPTAMIRFLSRPDRQFRDYHDAQ
jgi:hypothetical protein